MVVGIGSRPATDWLDGGGVEVDERRGVRPRRMTSAPHVWALGDVASWQDATGHQSRVEHWSNVAGAGASSGAVTARPRAAVESGCGARISASDHTTSRSNAWVSPKPDDVVHLVDDDGRKFLAYYERDGVVAGVVGGGMTGAVMKTRGETPPESTVPRRPESPRGRQPGRPPRSSRTAYRRQGR